MVRAAALTLDNHKESATPDAIFQGTSRSYRGKPNMAPENCLGTTITEPTPGSKQQCSERLFDLSKATTSKQHTGTDVKSSDF